MVAIAGINSGTQAILKSVSHYQIFSSNSRIVATLQRCRRTIPPLLQSTKEVLF